MVGPCNKVLTNIEQKSCQAAMDQRRRPEGAMAPLMEETTTNKVPKLLLEGAKITETT